MDCFDKILDVYKNKECPPISKEIWMNKYLIQLLRQPPNKESNIRLINCLLLMLNLFLTDSIDHYHRKGKFLEELDEAEKDFFKNILKSEISN